MLKIINKITKKNLIIRNFSRKRKMEDSDADGYYEDFDDLDRGYLTDKEMERKTKRGIILGSMLLNLIPKYLRDIKERGFNDPSKDLFEAFLHNETKVIEKNKEIYYGDGIINKSDELASSVGYGTSFGIGNQIIKPQFPPDIQAKFDQFREKMKARKGNNKTQNNYN